MYKVKDFEKLKNYGFVRYKDGYSKKVRGKDYDFLDVSFEDKIIKKVKFVNGCFVYSNAKAEDIPFLIKNKLVKEYKE